LQVSLVSATATNPFVGSWKLNYPSVPVNYDNSILYICANSVTATGIWNEEAVTYGILSSSHNNYTYKGSYFEGYFDTGCAYGTFNFVIGQDHNKFTGSYVCGSDGSSVTWTGTRVSSKTPTSVQCSDLAESGSFAIAGTYKDTSAKTTVDICLFKDATYEASSSDGSYEYGYIGENGVVLGGIRFTPGSHNNATVGQSLYYVNNNGNLYNLWWAGVDISSNRSPSQINNQKIHRYDSLTYVNPTNTQKCQRNQQLASENRQNPYYVAEQYFAYLFQYNYHNNNHNSNSSLISLSLLLFVICLSFSI